MQLKWRYKETDIFYSLNCNFRLDLQCDWRLSLQQ